MTQLMLLLPFSIFGYYHDSQFIHFGMYIVIQHIRTEVISIKGCHISATENMPGQNGIYTIYASLDRRLPRGNPDFCPRQQILNSSVLCLIVLISQV